MIGKTIGKYRIVDQLGRGGMGTVYQAVDETLDREVAVKVLNPGLQDSELMKRFRAEATTLAKLNHPEIATIHEIFRSDTDLLMVMELVRGETLDQLSQRSGPLPPERAAYLVAQVLGALGHAHQAGIVHRDLKPANIMVTDLGGIKIMDFGIARVAGAEHLTNDGHMMGTPAYMAPEQVMAKEVDGRADLYSCGVVFYRLLTGTLPFQADTAIGMVQKQLSDQPTPAHAHRADLPEWCETILDRALAKSPADRFQTAEEFRAALMSAIGSVATEHTGVYAAARLPGGTPAAMPGRRRWGRRPRPGPRLRGAAAAERRSDRRRDNRPEAQSLRDGRRAARGRRGRRRRRSPMRRCADRRRSSRQSPPSRPRRRRLRRRPIPPAAAETLRPRRRRRPPARPPSRASPAATQSAAASTPG